MRHFLYWLLSKTSRELRVYRRTLRKIARYDPKDADPLAAGALKRWAGTALAHRGRIFSGTYSQDMWDSINNAKSKRDLREALYFVCCRIQELESKIAKD